jgi:hypothetical protein
MRFLRVIFVGSFLLGIFSFGLVGAQAQQGGEKKSEKINPITFVESGAWLDTAVKMGLFPSGKVDAVKEFYNKWTTTADIEKNKEGFIKDVKDYVKLKKEKLADEASTPHGKKVKKEKLERQFNILLAIKTQKALEERRKEIAKWTNELQRLYNKSLNYGLLDADEAQKDFACNKLENMGINAGYCS